MTPHPHTHTRRATTALSAALLVALTFAAPLAAPLAAQQPVPSAGGQPPEAPAVPRRPSPAYVKYGKWLLLGGAIGMNVLAEQSHRRADDAFNELLARCDGNHALCNLQPDGTYADPASEQLYQRSRSYDGHARLWLLGGETALLGTAVMFIWELSRPKGPPSNIPFEPKLEVTPGRTRLGVAIPW